MAAVVLVGSALGLAHSCESGALGGRAIDGEQCHERAREPPVAHGAVGSLCVQVGCSVGSGLGCGVGSGEGCGVEAADFVGTDRRRSVNPDPWPPNPDFNTRTRSPRGARRCSPGSCATAGSRLHGLYDSIGRPLNVVPALGNTILARALRRRSGDRFLGSAKPTAVTPPAPCIGLLAATHPSLGPTDGIRVGGCSSSIR